MNIRPLHDRLIVKREAEERKSPGGIVIPDNATEKPAFGKVIAVGKGKILDNGQVRAPDKLSGGVAVIKVGAATEIEMKEKKARVEDALHATRAAVEEGVVPGGGVALIRALSALDNLRAGEDEKVGINITRKALEDPCRWIASNAGWEGAVVVDKIKNNKGAFGFNAATEEFEDLMKAGIIDTTKVVRSALQNAASVASLLLTTECMVAEKAEDKPSAPGMPPG